MIALVIVADGDQDRFVDTFVDLMTNADMSVLNPKLIVDASGDPDHRAWLEKNYGRAMPVIDIADYPTRPDKIELRVPVGALLDGRLSVT